MDGWMDCDQAYTNLIDDLDIYNHRKPLFTKFKFKKNLFSLLFFINSPNFFTFNFYL